MKRILNILVFSLLLSFFIISINKNKRNDQYLSLDFDNKVSDILGKKMWDNFELEDDLPPKIFRQGRPVVFFPVDEYYNLCNIEKAIACYLPDYDAIIMPNPCLPEVVEQTYAAALCHELGHANGWEHD